VQTYLERDVRGILSIRNLATFRRFMALLASRVGQVLNKTDMAGPLGVSVPTVTEWLGILETTGQILLVPPYFENFGKRLIKSPKLYLMDSGLACYLLGIDSDAMLRKSPFYGPVFEGFVASEIVKLQSALGRRHEIYHFRDQQGLEVDFIVPLGAGRLALIEAKASSTIRPSMGESLIRLAASIRGSEASRFVVHRRATHGPASAVVRPGVAALDVSGLETLLSGGRVRPSPRATHRSRSGRSF
jgi:hypothetical protein